MYPDTDTFELNANASRYGFGCNKNESYFLDIDTFSPNSISDIERHGIIQIFKKNTNSTETISTL